MRYNEAMSQERDKEPPKKEAKESKEPRTLAGSKDYDYYSLSSSKKILTGRGKV